MKTKGKKIARTREDIAVDAVNTVLMILVVILTLYPFYLVTILAFNSGTDSQLGGIYFLPRKPSLENFQNLLISGKWALGLGVSSSRTVIGTLIGVGFTAIVAYGMSFRSLIFRKFYFTAIIFANYFFGGLIADFVLYRNLHIMNTFWVYILPGMLDTFFMIVMITFFQDIPPSLQEAARIDGASEWKTFTRVILPLSGPILATAALFIGVRQWNSWLDSAYFIQNKNLKTLSYLMMEIINKSMIDSSAMNGGMDASLQTQGYANTSVTTRSLQMAAMVISVAPIVCIYPFLQKYFVKGIMLGSVKE